MKREILFKGKRVDTGKWVEGFLLKDRSLGNYITEGLGASGIEVHHETVCQFTGLTDKNGNKIFEGDKLNYTITPMNGKTTIIPYLVVFNVDGFQVVNLIKKFKAPYIDELFYRAPKRMTYKDWSKCEIIGNIHD